MNDFVCLIIAGLLFSAAATMVLEEPLSEKTLHQKYWEKCVSQGGSPADCCNWGIVDEPR